MPVDVITPDGQAHGSVAQRLLASGFNVNALRTNATLQKDEWIQFDETVVQIARQRLVGVADLVSRGLTYNLNNAMGTTIVEWEQISDMDPAEKSMDGITRTRDDRVEFNRIAVPIFITHKDFSINLRALEASRKLGQPLDTTQAAVAARLVSNDLESTLFNGASYVVASNATYGYTTHPARNTYEFESNLTWSDASKTGENILADLLGMIGVAHGDNMFGPYILYVPTGYWTALMEDFKANSDKSVMSRLMEIPSLEDVKVADFLSADQSVLVQMSSDVVDEIVGFQPTTVQWEEQGGFKINFKVMAIMIPRVKVDYDNRSGIVHGSAASGGGG